MRNREPKRTIQLVDLDHSGSADTEAYRMLWLQIQTVMARDGGSAFLVTSSLEKEGKTSVTCNLGLIAGIAGTRTLVIDGDLRRPMVHQAFGIHRAPGFTDLIAGSIDLDKVVVRIPQRNLWVIPAGKSRRYTTEILSSPRCDALLKDLRSRFDLVLVDTPPISVVPDAGAMVRLVDGIYFVIRSNHTSQRVVINAIRTLQDLGGEVRGTVLSRIDLSRERYYYRRGYPYYYSRYYKTEDEQESSVAPLEETKS